MRYRSRGAQTLVEFAICLPFLVMILVTIVNYGFLMYDSLATHAAMGEAVRAAVQVTAAGEPAYTDAQIRQIADEAHGPTFALLGSEIEVVRTANDAKFGGAQPSVTVRMVHTHAFALPVFLPAGPEQIIRTSMTAPMSVRR